MGGCTDPRRFRKPQRITKNRKESQGIAKNRKESQRIPKNHKESERIHRTKIHTDRRSKESQRIPKNPKRSQEIPENPPKNPINPKSRTPFFEVIYPSIHPSTYTSMLLHQYVISSQVEKKVEIFLSLGFFQT